MWFHWLEDQHKQYITTTAQIQAVYGYYYYSIKLRSTLLLQYQYKQYSTILNLYQWETAADENASQ